MDRRSFIKLTAVSGSTAALAACGNPDHQLIRFVPDEDVIPGQAIWKPSVCPLCPSGCGLTVRVMAAEADVVRNGATGVVQIYAAKKLEGTPGHPVSQGGLCPRGQAAIQVTYHPDRITQPLKRSGERGDGRYEAISWDAALGELASRLDTLSGEGNQRAVAYLARRGDSHRAALVSRFLGGYGAPSPVTWELFGDDVLRRANAISFGRDQLPTFDLANARYVLSFGADFLGTWNSPVAHNAAYGAMRQGRPGIRGSFVQFESRMSQTGANADEWVPVRPGTEGVIAQAIAAIVGGGEASLEEVEKATGVSARRIERIAREFVERGPSLAIVGGPPLAHTNGLFTALAVNALNQAAGAIDRPGGMYFTPRMPIGDQRTPGGDSFRLQPEGTAGRHVGEAQLLFVDGANPIYSAPRAWKLEDTLRKIPYIVSFGSFLDETSSLADLILPDHTFLESWTDAAPESGSMMAVISAAPPAMRPLYDTRATGDVLLDLGRRLATPVELPWQNVEEMLTATFTTLPPATEGGDTWSEVQEKGGWWGTLPAGRAAAPAPRAAAPTAAATFEGPQFAGDAQQYPFHFLPYPTTQFGEGETAHLPWLQEMPDPLTSAMWSSWVEINPQTAARLGIAMGDLVEVASEQGKLTSAAYISPGIAPDIVAMPMGQGHRMFTRYASGRGENPVDLLAPMTESATGELAWAATRVRITRVGNPDGRLILFAGGMHEHGGDHDHGHAGRG